MLEAEANGDLSYRDVQAIIASTSQPVDDEIDNTAGINAANHFHSNYYGFGNVNAHAAVEAAETWEPVGEETMLQASSDEFTVTVNIQIPDDASAQEKPIIESLVISLNRIVTIESVYIYLKLEHSSLKITLTSPSETRTLIARPLEDHTYEPFRHRICHHSGEKTRKCTAIKLNEVEIDDLEILGRKP